MKPSKKLEDLLSLAPVDDDDDNGNNDGVADDSFPTVIEENQLLLSEINNAIDKIDEALPTVRDLSAADTEMDELARLAVDTFQDLNSLGMNVEPRYSGAIFQTAATMLGHAITAKQAKLDKKLRMVDLQLKKARLDIQKAKELQKENGDSKDGVKTGTGIILDRNALLREILNQHEETKKE